jgi:hypothetical protein
MSIRREKRETRYHVNDPRIAHNRHAGWSGNSAFSARKTRFAESNTKTAIRLLILNPDLTSIIQPSTARITHDGSYELTRDGPLMCC